jgi:serine/threonine-protein kinase
MHEALRFPKPFGKYVLLRQLAVGGMAEVYLARQSGPAGFEKECVIKRILPSLSTDKQFVQMFLDEARIAARLSHPNIVQIFELGEQPGNDHFIAMEFVHGVDVQQILEAERARNGRVPLAVALRIVSNVAEGLEAAHRATDRSGHALGIVHRDVTPSNVIVSFDGVGKLCDFGIAKAVAKSGKTEVGVIKGKIPYMSPEQVEGQALDLRSDIFSVGVLLYELTTGKKPFDGSNPAEISLKILHDDPTMPQVLFTNYPDQLTSIVLRAMAKDPANRYSSARELQMALDEFLVGSGIRCTSHEVSGYLEELYPGRREQLAAQAAADAPAVPEYASDPTVPMMMTGGGPPTGGGDRPEPVFRDEFSGKMPGYDDARRNLGGGGGGGTRFIVVGLVIAVAVGFWWLRGHMKPEQPPAQPGASAPQPSVGAPGTPTPPVTGNPPPAAKPEEKPAAPAAELPAPGTAPTTAPAGEHTDESTATKPPAAGKTGAATPPPAAPKPEAKPEPKAAAKPAPKPAAKPAKPAPKPHPTEQPVKLPHLPSPPPADDNGE